MNTKPEKFSRVLTFLAVVAVCICKLEAQTTSIPASYALPAGAVDTSQPGFLVRPYQTDVTHGGTLAWSEGQLAGLDGPNTADLTGADAQGYLTVLTVVNWNISPGTAVDGFAGADAMPGIGSASTVNFTEEVLTYLNFPAAGTYTLGVNRDDGFGLAVAALNPKDQASAIEVGQRNGTGGAGDTTFSVSVAQAGFYPFRLLFFQLGGLANVSWFSVVTNGATTAQILINDTVAGAIKAYRAVTTASAYAQKVDPGVSANNVLPSEGIHIQMVDGATPLAASSISLVLDNTALTPSITKTGSVTYIDYSLPAPWASQTQHTVSLAFADGALKRTNSWQFTVQNYISLDPAWRVTAVDTNKAGFNWNIFANSDSGRLSPNNGNSNERAESDLRLQAVDSTGATLPNLATPSAVGAAIGAGVAPSAPNSPVHFEIATTLKLDVATLTMPGMPATDSSPNGVAAEVLTYLALPAGVIAMEVDSDNGWRLYAGANPADAFGRNVVAEHNDGTGPVQFSFVVSQSGIYPFRLVWESGTSATPYLDWYSIDKSGNTVLVNDVAHGGVPAYRALVAGTTVAPFVMGVAPVPALHQMEVANTNLTIVIADGSKPVDDNSVTLTVDGKNITPVKKRQGNLLTISDGGAAFPGLQLPSDVHSATLTYKDSSGASTRNQQWTFNNIQILVLPAAPLVQENFDSYPEATSPANTVPPGWTASNFTAINTTN